MLSGILDIGSKLVDRLIPDKEKQAQAKAELLRLAQEGEFKELEERMSAIRAEAQSDDPWTSRARPSFLYVMYVYLLAGIPMGVVAAFSPETAAGVGDGMGAWLSAIPSELYALFGAGYLGYAGFRTLDKRDRNGMNKIKEKANALF